MVAAVRQHGVRVVLAGDAGRCGRCWRSWARGGDRGRARAGSHPDGRQRGADAGPARHQRGGRLRAGRQRPGPAPWCRRARPAAPSPPQWRRSAAHRGCSAPAIAVTAAIRPAGARCCWTPGPPPTPPPRCWPSSRCSDRATPGPSWASSHPRWGCSRAPSRAGQPLARRAQPVLCSAPVRFTGNVEGRDALAGAVDVVVTDGFTGNVVLKTIEGSLRLAVADTRAALAAGRPAGMAGSPTGAGCAAWPSGSTPTRTAGRCCSAWVARSSSRTGRPAPGPSAGPACWPGTWSGPGSPGRSAGRSPDHRPAPCHEPPGRERSGRELLRRQPAGRRRPRSQRTRTARTGRSIPRRTTPPGGCGRSPPRAGPARTRSRAPHQRPATG